MATVSPWDGASCLLWEDGWNGQPLRIALPELFSFAKKPNISLQLATSSNDHFNLFMLPLSVEAFQQFQLLTNLLQQQHQNVGLDVWTYIWGNASFSSKKAYSHLLGNM
jgi:hypothetical protein